jgi:hypothetical protein
VLTAFAAGGSKIRRHLVCLNEDFPGLKGASAAGEVLLNAFQVNKLRLISRIPLAPALMVLALHQEFQS